MKLKLTIIVMTWMMMTVNQINGYHIYFTMYIYYNFKSMLK